jgi:hypothetical protein
MALPLDCIHIIHSYLPFETCMEVCDACAQQQYARWYTCKWAVQRMNPLSKLQWLHSHNHCNCNRKTIAKAITCAPLEVLQFILAENPNLARPAAFYKAIQYGRLDIVKWLNSDYPTLFTTDMFEVACAKTWYQYPLDSTKANWEICEYLLVNRLEVVPSHVCSRMADHYMYGFFDLITLRAELIYKALKRAISRIDIPAITTLRSRLDQPLRVVNESRWREFTSDDLSTVMNGFLLDWEYSLARYAALGTMYEHSPNGRQIECLEALRCAPKVITGILGLSEKYPNGISLRYGAQNGDLKMVQYVCAHRTVSQTELRDAYMHATMNGHMEVVKWMASQSFYKSCSIL